MVISPVRSIPSTSCYYSKTGIGGRRALDRADMPEPPDIAVRNGGHDTYEERLREAERGMRGLRRQGFIVRKVDVDVDEMVRWCEANQLPFDGGARAQFVAKKVHDAGEP